MVLRTLVQETYDRTVRERLPRKYGVLNGVVARYPRLFDSTEVDPDYEAEVIDALKTHVEDGDRVVVVGGGLGVTAVIAAQQGGTVTAFEASRERYETLRETLAINGVAEQVDAHHALVGPAVDVSGELADREIRPDSLPECDVLEIDAEGSEVAILKGLAQRPRVLIVECHRDLGAPVNDVWPILDRLDYDVVDQETVDREKGIYVLTAVRE